MSEYFTPEHFDLLKRWGGQKYDSKDPEKREAYDKLKEAYDITAAWAEKVQAALLPSRNPEVRKRPTNQANNFIPYNWAKIYPTAGAPKELAYTVGINAGPGFVVKIDTVGLSDDDAIRKAYLRLRGDDNSSPFVAMLSAPEGLDKTLDELAKWSIEAISHFKLDYGQVVAKLNLSPVIDDEVVLKHFDGKPEFKECRVRWSPEEAALFCRLARVVHSAGLDWYHVNLKAQVRFGRKNPGGTKAKAVFGYILATTPPLIRWYDHPEQVTGQIRTTLTEQLVKQLEDVIGNATTVLATRFPLESNRSGFWPDELTPENDDQGDLSNQDEDSDEQMINQPLNLILFGPPGTGKTHRFKSEYGKHFPGAQKEMVTFHPSFTYEEFVEGLRPVSRNDGQVTYDVVPGVFKRLCDRARLNLGHRFAIFIDEINRANVAAVFGELITLIEEDMRGIEITLPYSKEQFSIPKNLYIIGTMNTSDRSIALLDMALRRRFEFEEVGPEPLLLLEDVEGVNVRALLIALNERLEILYDRDHVIGHAWLQKDKTLAGIKRAFASKIIPLLREYFYDDWAKICLVLGEDPEDTKAPGFIFKKLLDEANERILFGRALGGKPRFLYRVADEASWTVEMFRRAAGER